VLTTRRSRTAAAAAALLVLALLAGVVLYAGFRKRTPFLPSVGTGCEARSSGDGIPMAASQAAIAATIAGVAQRLALPDRAVTIAYAAALQESKLQNLDYGDRDSVGIFQQRPSQGWGPARKLEDPVYATDKFFAALVAVPRYQRLPVYKAAQAVQRSADGYAYSQYAWPGAIMSRAFTGRAARGVWCWYGRGIAGPVRLAAAVRGLTHAFGPLDVASAGDPMLIVRVPRARYGWAEAGWLVTHARAYGIRAVRFAGLQWTAARGVRGWRAQRRGARAKPPRGTVVLG
jgi:hypothetical protein